MAKVTIKNLERVLHKFDNIADVDLKDVVNKATKLVHGQAKELAPVDKGDLVGSIHMESKKIQNGYQGRVYTNSDHSAYVEFGTGIKGNGSYPYTVEGLDLKYHEEWAGMKAQPYMYPALHVHKKNIEKLLKQGTKDNIRKSVKGGK